MAQHPKSGSRDECQVDHANLKRHVGRLAAAIRESVLAAWLGAHMTGLRARPLFLLLLAARGRDLLAAEGIEATIAYEGAEIHREGDETGTGLVSVTPIVT